MTFATLFNWIGKRPIKDTQGSPLVAVLYRDDLKRLLNENKYSQTITIPLDIKTGVDRQKMWFVKQEEKNNAEKRV